MAVDEEMESGEEDRSMAEDVKRMLGIASDKLLSYMPSRRVLVDARLVE